MAQLQESCFQNIRIGRGNGNCTSNTVIGQCAGDSLNGNANVIIGFCAGRVSTCFNTFIGACAGRTTTNCSNTFIGFRAGDGCCSSTTSTLIGSYTAITGSIQASVGIGFKALNHGGNLANGNVGIGFYTLRSTNACRCNVAVGFRALDNNTNCFNVAVGYRAGENTGSSSCQVFIGDRTGRFASTGYTNRIGVGFYSYQTNYRSNSGVLGRYVVQYAYAYTSWSDVSDIRDKTEISLLDDNLGINFIRKLRPVKYKMDHRISYVNKCGFEWGQKDGTLKRKKTDYGFIAQEIDNIKKELNIIFDAVTFNDISDSWSIRSLELLSPIVKSIQYLNNELDMIENKLIE